MVIGNLPPIEESRRYGSFLNAAVLTWLGACFQPRRFFYAVGNSSEVVIPLIFGVICGWIGSVLPALLSLAFQAPFIMTGRQTAKLSLLLQKNPNISQDFAIIAALLLSWLVILISIFLWSLIIHMFLLVFGGANQGLTMTLRVLCYSYASYIFNFIPFVGPCIAGIWLLVLWVIGLAMAHRTDLLRVIGATLFSLVMFCCIAALVGVLAALVLGRTL